MKLDAPCAGVLDGGIAGCVVEPVGGHKVERVQVLGTGEVAARRRAHRGSIPIKEIWDLRQIAAPAADNPRQLAQRFLGVAANGKVHVGEVGEDLLGKVGGGQPADDELDLGPDLFDSPRHFQRAERMLIPVQVYHDQFGRRLARQPAAEVETGLPGQFHRQVQPLDRPAVAA